MRGSHGDGRGNKPLEEEARARGLLSDWSGQDADSETDPDAPQKLREDGTPAMPSDKVNLARGSRLEGTSDPSPRVEPHFVTLRVATDADVPKVDPYAGLTWASWSPRRPDYVPDTAFGPVVADGAVCIYGWLPDAAGEWHPIEAVRRLTIDAGRVTAYMGEEGKALLADFGPDVAAAAIYRARVAHYIAECKGYEFFPIPDSPGVEAPAEAAERQPHAPAGPTAATADSGGAHTTPSEETPKNDTAE